MADKEYVVRLVVDAAGGRTELQNFTKEADAAAAPMKRIARAYEEVQAKTDPVFRALLTQQREVEKATLAAADAVKYYGVSQDAANKQIQKTTDYYSNLTNKAREVASAQTFVGKALNGVSGQLVAMAAGAGPVGVALASFGPGGVAAAVGLAAVENAISAASKSAHKFAGDMLKFRDSAEAIELTTVELQALNDTGAKFALTEDKIASTMQRFTAQLDETRRGQGDLYAMLLRIDPALANEMALSRDTATAIDVLAKAYDKAGTSKQKLDRLIGGKQGGTIGLLFQDVGKQGGMDNVTDEFKKSGDAIDDALIKRVARLKAEIADMSQDAKRNIASIYSAEVLEREKVFTEKFLEFSRDIKNFTPGQWDKFKDGLLSLLPVVGPLANIVNGIRKLPTYKYDPSNPSGYQSSGDESAGLNIPGQPLPRTRPTAQIDRSALELEINTEKKRIEALGTAATASEKLALKQKEINLNRHDAILQGKDFDKAMDSASLEKAIQVQGQYLSLMGQAAPTIEIVAQKMRELKKSDADFTKDEIANIKRVATEAANGSGPILQQADAQKIAAQTAGLAAGEAAALSAKLQLLAQDARAGKVATEADTKAREEAIQKLREQAQAAASASVNSQIKFDRATAGLSQEDVQIAQQLRTLYGNDVPTALNSTEAAQIRVTNRIKESADAAREFGQNLLGGLIQGRSVMDSLGSASQSLITKLASKQLDKFMSGDFSSPGAEGLMSGQGALGVAAAGFSGYQSGSPVGGALGGAMAGYSIGGPAGAVVGGAVGLIGGLLGASKKKKELQRQQMEAAQQRAEQYHLDAQLAGLDTSNIEGALKAFDIQAASQRAQEMRMPYAQMAALEESLSAKRLAIIKDFNDAVLAEAKEIQEYARSLKASDLSTFTPEQKLAELQAKYDATYAAAIGGDHDASGRLTSDADAFLQFAKDFYASSENYASIFDKIYGQLSTFQGVLYKANGGVITGGVPGVDSVPVMAMPGEFFVNAEATQKNRALLEAINSGMPVRQFASGGMVGANQPVKSFGASGMSFAHENTAHFAEVGKMISRTIAAASMENNTTLRHELGAVREELARVSTTLRIEAKRPPRPGTKKEAA